MNVIKITENEMRVVEIARILLQQIPRNKVRPYHIDIAIDNATLAFTSYMKNQLPKGSYYQMYNYIMVTDYSNWQNPANFSE